MALDLGADTGDPPPGLLVVYSSLLCTAAYTAAKAGQRHHALELIGEAEHAAARIGDARTSFGATNVTVYQIGVRTTLGDPGTALEHAARINPRVLPSPERRARFCIDTARAWDRFGNPAKCYQALRAAERFAPEEVRRPSVRTIATGLLNAPGPTLSGLREFATRCGVTS